MIVFRIADARHPIFDSTGAMLHGARWNSPGQRAIYAAETYAGAMLEVLVHGNLSVPPKHHRLVRINIPDRIRIETVLPSAVAGWDAEELTAPRAFGDQWLRELRTAVLRVPSVVTQGREYNVMINPLHRQYPMIQATTPEEVHWDVRLFQKKP